MNSTLKWVDPHQPQTLQIAVILLYINAVFMVLGGGLFTGIGLLVVVGYVGGGLGIANEKRYGYFAAIGVVALIVIWSLSFGLGALDDVNFLISLLFDVALLALLLHPQSRDYQKIWFR